MLTYLALDGEVRAPRVRTAAFADIPVGAFILYEERKSCPPAVWQKINEEHRENIFVHEYEGYVSWIDRRDRFQFPYFLP